MFSSAYLSVCINDVYVFEHQTKCMDIIVARVLSISCTCIHSMPLTHTYTHTHHRVQELCKLQDKHATRPDVFDDVEEEQEIEILTQEISQVRVS